MGYYVGARLGVVLRLPPATTSVLWPPNAILTAVLLLSTPRRFWIWLLAALPAHVLALAEAGFPASFVLTIYATNCLEAVLAAWVIHRWSDAPDRLDTLYRVTVFVVGSVLVAPIVSTFADAAVVHHFLGEDYWQVWLRRVFSNTLGQLTLLPALLLVLGQGASWVRAASARRLTEAALIAFGLVFVGLQIFTGSLRETPFPPGGPYTALPLLLPLMILAAVRFGPGGASLTLLATALLAIGTALAGFTPLRALPVGERVLALQVFLIVVGVPLLVLSALTEERRLIAETLLERLRFEEFLSQLSGAFVHTPGDEITRALETWLERVGRFLGVNRVALWQLSSNEQAIEVVARWSDPPSPVALVELRRADFRWAEKRMLAADPCVWPAPEELPEEAAPEGRLLLAAGVRDLVTLPLLAGTRAFGSLALASTRERKPWPAPLVQRCRLVADVFAGALARQRAERGLRASESVKSAVLASLTSHVAVLDREGRIISANDSWTRFVRQNGGAAAGAEVEGASYSAVCREASGTGAAQASELWAGIQGVLDGSRASFGVDYRLSTTPPERWFHLMAVPLLRPEGGAVVSHTEVTERRRAELEAQRSRQDLAHALRVSTIGELTTSLAHELNQPLAAILANAQAGRRMLADEAKRGELREILEEVIEDGKRAGEVIQRLRDLLRKGETERAPLDLNALVQDVVKLLGNDVMLRGVTLRSELAPGRLTTRGDPVQLRQVLLNLVINALEALAEVEGERRVLIRTERLTGGLARTSVEDTGPGLRPPDGSDVFKPFYTTKEKGMGMGLSIARSILESHGGAITAWNNPRAGASFAFTLPLLPMQA
jgi:signal transduction histidine kinase/integral membrane sensor domain MASE1